MSLSNDQIVEALGQKTIPEIIALTKHLEETWGVKASPVPAPGIVLPHDGTAPTVEEQTEFAVVIKEVGAKKIEVIKALRGILNLGLAEAKTWVEGIAAPKAVKEGLSKKEAEEVQATLVAAGATVVLQ